MDKTTEILRSLRVGFFLAIRAIRRNNPWTTGLIVFIMVLTFLNLIVVNGVLVGLVEGSSIAWRNQYSGDIIVTPQPENIYIENSEKIIEYLFSLGEVKSVTVRHIENGTIETERIGRYSPNELAEKTTAQIAGIYPLDEDAVSKLSALIIEGEFLKDNDNSGIILGSGLIKQYSPFNTSGFRTLENIEIGKKVYLTTNGNRKAFTVIGIIKSKIGEVNRRAYVVQSQFQKIFPGNPDPKEIVVLLKNTETKDQIKRFMETQGFGENNSIKTWKESQGEFYDNISRTFTILGAFIGAIGLAVASITIFIVIFVNAITRKRYIGILKGIGINERAIEISYVFQAIVYATAGAIIGLLILYGAIKPYFDNNPIDFPFSDGILVAPLSTVFIRLAMLFMATIIAGYFPAKIITKKNTLDSILGR